MITKEKFLEIIEFINKKNQQQEDLAKAFEAMCPGLYTDTLVYSEYEDKILELLTIMLDDDTGLISYKLYEFDTFLDDETKAEQIKETPEVETWEKVYDYLITQQEVKKYVC